MRTLRLTVLFAVLIAAVAAVPAGAKAPPVVKHTYLVQYQLSGTYTAVTRYTNNDAGFCVGTGFTETSEFSVLSAHKLTIKLQGSGHVGAYTVLSSDPGTWSMQGNTISSGDPCSALKHKTCAGTLTTDADGATNALYAIGRKKQILFQSTLGQVPLEVQKPHDCDQDQDYYPVPTYNLADALAPYAATTYGISLTKLATLKKGKKIVGKAKPVKYPRGYDVSTCDGDDACTGSFSKLKSTITVTRR
jgi:hypothetical protein